MTRVALATLLLLLAVVAGSALRPVWSIDPDASLYLGLGQSLAAGHGYALDGVPHTKYPPGFPLLLSGLIRLGSPTDYRLFHAALVTAWVAAVALIFLLARRLGYAGAVALAVAALTALSQTLFDLSVVYLRTEVLFLALSVAALLALQKALAEEGTAGWTLAAAALCVAAMSVRLAGVALAAVPTMELARRSATRGVRWRALTALLACGLALAAWQARSQSVAREHPGAPDYGKEFLASEPRDLTKIVREDMSRLDAAGLVHRVEGNLDVMARAMAVLLTNVDRAGSRLPVGVLLLGLVIGGLALLWRSERERVRRRQVVSYSVALLLLCLLWPFNQQERFYVPLLPVLFLAAGECAVALWRAARKASGTPLGRGAIAMGGAALLVVLALQRSDHPMLLQRWSWSYAALLAALGAAWLGALLWLRGGRVLPPPSRALLALVPALAVLPFAHHAFVEWPGQKRDFEEHRARDPQPEPLARIDVDPRLEQVAVFLRDRVPSGTVLMTDVPAMLEAMSGRRCIPFVYTVNPPRVLTGTADLVFYTREIAEASAVMDAVAPGLQPAFALPAIEEDGRTVVPTVFRAH